MKKQIKKIICIIIISILCNSICAFAEGFRLIDGEFYWYNEDGSVATGFIFDDDKVFYADDTGKVLRATISGTYHIVYDNHYQGVFYVDDKGIVGMNITTEPHWMKAGNDWYHYGYNGVLDRNKWIVDTENRKIYRVDYAGKLCHGWAADSDTHMTYYFDLDPDSGALLYDSFGTPYDEIYETILESVNVDGKYTNNLYSAPLKNNE